MIDIDVIENPPKDVLNLEKVNIYTRLLILILAVVHQ